MTPNNCPVLVDKLQRNLRFINNSNRNISSKITFGPLEYSHENKIFSNIFTQKHKICQDDDSHCDTQMVCFSACDTVHWQICVVSNIHEWPEGQEAQGVAEVWGAVSVYTLVHCHLFRWSCTAHCAPLTQVHPDSPTTNPIGILLCQDLLLWLLYQDKVKMNVNTGSAVNEKPWERERSCALVVMQEKLTFSLFPFSGFIETRATSTRQLNSQSQTSPTTGIFVTQSLKCTFTTH